MDCCHRRRDFPKREQCWNIRHLNFASCYLTSLISLRPALNLETETAIAKTKRELENRGNKPQTCKKVESTLTRLAREADIFDPDKVLQYIAHAKKTDPLNGKLTDKDWSDPYKAQAADIYAIFCEINNILFKKPSYKRTSPIPLIPSPENVEAIISSSSKRMATVFRIMSETGIEGFELEIIPRNQIDSQQGIISVVGVKRHDNGTYKLKDSTAEMLRQYLAKHPEEYPFPKVKNTREAWMNSRETTASKLGKPELKKIPLKNLRNYAGAVFYTTMGKDPIQTMHFMRHKKLERTMDYLRGLTQFSANVTYISKVATTAEEAIELLNQGFKEEAIFGEKHLYRKLK